MPVPFEQYDASPFGAVDITPTDAAIITTGRSRPFRGLYVGGAGNVSVRLLDGSTHTFFGVTAGTTLPLQFDMVNETSTTATHLIGLY